MRRRTMRGRRGDPHDSLVPYVVLILVVFSWELLRFSFFVTLPLTCVPTYALWTAPSAGAWPLFGSFAVVFALLLAWTIAVSIDLRRARWLDRGLVVAGGIAVLVVCAGLWSVLDSMQRQSDDDAGAYSAWLRTPEWPVFDDACRLAQPYLGTWNVVSIEAPFLGQTFPYERVELRRDWSLTAGRSRFGRSFDGHWHPSDRRRGSPGWLSTDEVEGIWDWTLSGDRLTLKTWFEMDQPTSTVVLERAAP